MDQNHFQLRSVKTIKVEDDAIIVNLDGTNILLHKSTAKGIVRYHYSSNIVLELSHIGCKISKDTTRKLIDESE